MKINEIDYFRYNMYFCRFFPGCWMNTKIAETHTHTHYDLGGKYVSRKGRKCGCQRGMNEPTYNRQKISYIIKKLLIVEEKWGFFVGLSISYPYVNRKIDAYSCYDSFQFSIEFLCTFCLKIYWIRSILKVANTPIQYFTQRLNKLRHFLFRNNILLGWIGDHECSLVYIGSSKLMPRHIQQSVL